jgi:hypothetical protein
MKNTFVNQKHHRNSKTRLTIMINVAKTLKDATAVQAAKLAVRHWIPAEFPAIADHETSISHPHLSTGLHTKTKTRFTIAVTNINTTKQPRKTVLAVRTTPSPSSGRSGINSVTTTPAILIPETTHSTSASVRMGTLLVKAV